MLLASSPGVHCEDDAEALHVVGHCCGRAAHPRADFHNVSKVGSLLCQPLQLGSFHPSFGGQRILDIQGAILSSKCLARASVVSFSFSTVLTLDMSYCQ